MLEITHYLELKWFGIKLCYIHSSRPIVHKSFGYWRNRFLLARSPYNTKQSMAYSRKFTTCYFLLQFNSFIHKFSYLVYQCVVVFRVRKSRPTISLIRQLNCKEKGTYLIISAVKCFILMKYPIDIKKTKVVSNALFIIGCLQLLLADISLLSEHLESLTSAYLAILCLWMRSVCEVPISTR